MQGHVLLMVKFQRITPTHTEVLNQYSVTLSSILCWRMPSLLFDYKVGRMKLDDLDFRLAVKEKRSIQKI